MYSFVDNPVGARLSHTKTAGESSSRLAASVENEHPAVSYQTSAGAPASLASTGSIGTGNSHHVPRGNTELIFLALHGMGMDTPSVVLSKKEFRETVRSVRKHWFWEVQLATHIEFIDWRSLLCEQQAELFRRCTALGQTASRFPSDIVTPFMRSEFADLLCFLNEKYGDSLISSMRELLNATVERVRRKNDGKYKHASVVLIGHSLGGVILHEILTGVHARPTSDDTIQEPALGLTFPVQSLVLLGCPLAALLAVHRNGTLTLPSGVRVYNIYHERDNLATRLEPLYYTSVDTLPPAVLLPNWKTNVIRSKASKRPSGSMWNLHSAASRVRNMLEGTPNQGSADEDGGALPQGAVVHLALSADKRYGTHERKPSSPEFGRTIGTLRTMQTGVKRVQKPASLGELFDILEIDEHDRSSLRSQMTTGLGEDDAEHIRLPPRVTPADVDILSESETGPGLELPVRLDFEIQGPVQGQINYWASRDMAFFLLKQAVSFRPRVAYPDFLRALDFAEHRHPITGESSSTAADSRHNIEQQTDGKTLGPHGRSLVDPSHHPNNRLQEEDLTAVPS